MKTRKHKMIVTLFALMFFSLSSTVHAETQAVDPAATEILKRMTDYLGSLKQFSVETQNTLEDLLVSGHRVDLDISADVILSRPNKVRSERKGDLVNHVFYYDGKSMTLYNPSYNVYASAPVPDTFEGLFKYMYVKLGIGVPISDLVYQDAYPLLMQDVNYAAVIGKSYVGGVKCDHLLFSRPGVDFQIWISEGSRPLPLKYVITGTEDTERLSVSTIMSDWNVEPGLKDAQFSFVPPEGAQAVSFMQQ
ncbi:MAG: DUF2092 domain-containing protein [Thermodesulfobacteriota bacterium]|nr:DUF2092 domain-containing protein [Thermodesulfobacteriota bacterium]